MVLPTYHRHRRAAGRGAGAPRRVGGAGPRRRGQRALRAAVVASALAVAAPWALRAQPAAQAPPSIVEQMAAGDRENAARRPALALAHYEAVLRAEPRNADAHWKAARELVDLGEVERSASVRAEQYERAVAYARRAVALTPLDAEAHFHLSRALGRYTMEKSPRDRVKYAGDVRTHALRALEIAPRHPGALHVMGVWHAEVMRLNGFARAFARTFLGGKVFDSASWAEATRFLEECVAIEPERAVHRLDLARIYRDTGRKPEARAQYEATLRAPLIDPNDEFYQASARNELRALK